MENDYLYDLPIIYDFHIGFRGCSLADNRVECPGNTTVPVPRSVRTAAEKCWNWELNVGNISQIITGIMLHIHNWGHQLIYHVKNIYMCVYMYAYECLKSDRRTRLYNLRTKQTYRQTG